MRIKAIPNFKEIPCPAIRLVLGYSIVPMQSEIRTAPVLRNEGPERLNCIRSLSTHRHYVFRALLILIEARCTPAIRTAHTLSSKGFSWA